MTDWTGPYGRLRRMTFRMLGSVFPGDTMVFQGMVTDSGVDGTGCGWVGIDISVSVDGDAKTTCRAQVALPLTEDDNPWSAGRGHVDAVSRHPVLDTPLTFRHEPKRSTDHVGPAFQPGAGDVAGDRARRVRHHQPVARGPPTRGRPDRLLPRSVEAARPSRPHRAPAARGVRGVGHDRVGGRRPLRGTRPGAGPVAPFRERDSLRRRLGPGRRQRTAAGVAARPRLRRGHPDPGVARARQRVRSPGRAGAGRARPRRLRPLGCQAPRGVRQGGHQVAGAGPDRRRPHRHRPLPGRPDRLGGYPHPTDDHRLRLPVPGGPRPGTGTERPTGWAAHRPGGRPGTR